MYAWYQNLHLPTGISHCVECNFTSKKANNLIVVAGTQLTLYNLLENIEIVNPKNKGEKKTKDKLEQIGTWQLYGVVSSLEHVKLPGSATDALIISFKNAKLSVIRFDPAVNDIKTLSLHYFEQEVEDYGAAIKNTVPKTCVDPEGRCACMLISEATIAVLPFASRDALAPLNSSSSTAWEKLQITESYNIDLKQVNSQLQNIIDLKFLHGYYEPTLLILFEPLQTWAGRIAVRQDTCSIVAVSLNLTEKIHPVIWSLGNLPYNCKRAFPVPKPIGGVLIFTTNALLYLNQSVPPSGITLNNSNKNSTSFPLTKLDCKAITLDRSNGTFIAPDKLCVSLNNGDLYIFSLLIDTMRSIHGFAYEKVASSVLTSCITTLGDNFLFLGSRLGNSVMLKYTEDNSVNLTATDQPALKRKRLNTEAEWTATDDDFDVYGPSTANKLQNTSYKFDVCDSILNIGPCAYTELGEPAYLSEEFVHQRDADLELLLVSGHGKNGALTILQKSIKPQVVTTFELPGCTNMWTVKGSIKEVIEVGTVEFDSYLILSRDDDTLILETAQEIMEVEKSGFCTQQKTIFAGNVHLGEGESRIRLILQVCPFGIWLLDGIDQLEHLPLDLDAPIVSCSLCDPFAALLLKDGQMVLATIELRNNKPKIILSNPHLQQSPRLEIVHLYKDESGIFQTDDAQITMEATAESKPSFTPLIPAANFSADDEDELLYGDNTDCNIFEASNTAANIKVNSPRSEESKTTSYWMFIVRRDCTMEIYSIPEVQLVYSVKNCSMGNKLLTDSFAMQSQTQEGGKHTTVDRPRVFEVMVKGFGYNKNRVHLFIRISQDMLVYEAFKHVMPTPDNIHRQCLQVRFKKLNHNMQLRHSVSVNTQPRLCSFEDVGGYSGVFLCGPYAHWFFNSTRGIVRYHPMFVDGPISSFVSFHNVNCPNGFLYFNNRSELRICMLPSHMVYDNEWPVHKVPLQRTAHFITYSIHHKVYSLVTSVEEPCNRIPFMNQEGDREVEELEPNDDFVPPTYKKFTLELISPVKWELIPNSKKDMEEYEHITCMKNVWLSTPSNLQRQNYVVCGTAYVMGEEINCRGRIFVNEIIEVVPEPGKPLTKNKLKHIFEEDQKGPVTALCGVEGYLLSAVGQKVFVFKMDDDFSLRAMAFVDSSIYVHQAFSFKSFVIIADIQKSITLLRFQTDFKTLSIISRDFRPLVTYSTELVVDGQSVGFLVADEDKNLIMYSYKPEAFESVGGARLLRRADINIGANVATMWRTATANSDPATGARNIEYAKNHLTMMATLDGAIGCFMPVSEKIYRRLFMLQNTMVNSLQHVAGLNPKSFRQIICQTNAIQNPMRNVLDGDLLRRFTQLGFSEKHELSKKIGTTSKQILKDLMEIQKATFVM